MWPFLAPDTTVRNALKQFQVINLMLAQLSHTDVSLEFQVRELENLQQQYILVGVEAAENSRLKAQLQQWQQEADKQLHLQEQLKQEGAVYQQELQQLRWAVCLLPASRRLQMCLFLLKSKFGQRWRECWEPRAGWHWGTLPWPGHLFPLSSFCLGTAAQQLGGQCLWK